MLHTQIPAILRGSLENRLKISWRGCLTHGLGHTTSVPGEPDREDVNQLVDGHPI